MNTILMAFLCAMLVALPAPAGAETQPIRKEAPLAITQPSPEIGTELKLQQQKLEFFKERLDLQDKRIGDLGMILGGVIGLFGIMITGIVVFFSFRSTREAVLAAKDEARNWIDKDGKKHLEALLEPEIDAATKKIQDAASSVLGGLEEERQRACAYNQHQKDLIDLLSKQMQNNIPPTTEQKKAVNEAAGQLDSKAPVTYQFGDWLTLGIKAFQEGKFEIAEENFRNAAEVAETSVDRAKALINKGVTLSQMKKNEEAVAVYDEVVQRYGNASEAALCEWVVGALVNMGITLGRMGKSDEEIAVYDEVIRRYGDVPEAVVREQVAGALVSKGITLGQMGKNEEAVAVYDEVARRYGNAPEAVLRVQVARALNSKGNRLGEIGKIEEAVAVYDEVVRRYGDAPEAVLREQVAGALNNKGNRLGEIGKNDEAIAIYDEVVRRYGNAPEAVLREQVARTLVNKGFSLSEKEKNIEAIAVYDEVVKRYGNALEVALREEVAKALNGKAFHLLFEAKKIWQNGDELSARAFLARASVNIEAALQRKPDDPMALGNQGYILFLQGKTEQASEVLAEAIRLGGEKVRQDELMDAEIHPLPQDEAFKQLINRL